MKYVVEKESREGFTLIKVDEENKVCGRFIYRTNGRLEIANATMCKRNKTSIDVTDTKLNNFFDQAMRGCWEPVFEERWYNELIRYCIEKADKDRSWYRPRTFRVSWFKTPQLEILLKAGYREALISNGLPMCKGTSPAQILNMNKIQLKIYKEYHQRIKIDDVNFLNYYYKTVKEKTVQRKQALMFESHILDKTYELYKKYNYNLELLIDYAVNACQFTQGIDSPREVLTLLRDTNNMYKLMGAKFKDKYTKNLKKEHDLISAKYRIHVTEEMEDKYKVIREENKELEFDTKDYVFLRPRTLQDIKQEGVDLNHCVASYCNRVLDRETYIIFMRRKNQPDDALITIEVRNKQIIQHRGYSNRDPLGFEKESITKYKEYLQTL